MGSCVTRLDTNASQSPSPPRNEDVLVRIKKNRPLDDLSIGLVNLHEGMPMALKEVPMRLLKITEVLSWDKLIVYEEVSPQACLDKPYLEVNDVDWDVTVVLSWCWGASKPNELQHDFSPMLKEQFVELHGVLTQLCESGLQYVWIDWCCVPQYSTSPMVEIMRSKVFYARACAMIIIPTFHKLPHDSIVQLLLRRAMHVLKDNCSKSPPCAVAADVIDCIIKVEMVAGREYFSRLWTLVERMARHGRAEQLCNWLSLEAWLGMVVDAMLKPTEDLTASQVYKKFLGKEAGDLLDDILEPLAEAVKTSSMDVAEGLDNMVAKLFEMAVNTWNSPSVLEEAPTTTWLLSYLEEAHTAVYQASNEHDRVWAVYSYYSWKQLDQLQLSAALGEALQSMVHVTGAHRRHMLSLAKKLGVEKLLPVEEVDQQLLKAARDGEGLVITGLINKGANVHAVDKQQDGATPLCMAARYSHEAAIKYLLDAGADIDGPNDDGRTPLFVAATDGHVAAMKCLLDAGANKDKKDKVGWTPLHVVASKGHVAAVKCLLDAGDDRDKLTSGGETPLCVAAAYGREAVVKYLLDAGADKDKAADYWVTTPLSAAARNGHAAVVKCLLDAGADKNKANIYGKKPKDVVKAGSGISWML